MKRSAKEVFVKFLIQNRNCFLGVDANPVLQSPNNSVCIGNCKFFLCVSFCFWQLEVSPIASYFGPQSPVPPPLIQKVLFLFFS